MDCSLFREREYKKAECLVLEFSRYTQSQSATITRGVINLTSFVFNVKKGESIENAFRRKARKKGIDIVTCHTEDLTIQLADVVLMVSALATPGYDLQNNNCRHFARSLYWSCRNAQKLSSEKTTGKEEFVLL